MREPLCAHNSFLLRQADHWPGLLPCNLVKNTQPTNSILLPRLGHALSCSLPLWGCSSCGTAGPRVEPSPGLGSWPAGFLRRAGQQLPPQPHCMAMALGACTLSPSQLCASAPPSHHWVILHAHLRATPCSARSLHTLPHICPAVTCTFPLHESPYSALAPERGSGSR